MVSYNLVFSGSASMYPTHLGAAQALYETVFFKQYPAALVGASGGAIIAALLSGGMLPKDCFAALKKILPKDYVTTNHAGWWDRLCHKKKKRLGTLSLEPLEKILERHVPKTFANVAIPLHIVAVDLASTQEVVWSCEASPVMSVAKAARISASMPGIFALTYIEDQCLTDGGLLKSYPIDLLPGPSIGVLLRSRNQVERAVVYPKNELDLGIRCIETMRRGQEREHVADAAAWARTVVIEVPWNSLDFLKLDTEAMEKLYAVGYRRTREALDQGLALAL